MTDTNAITCLFLDIGGVILTNGWDHHARKRAADHFHFDYTEMESRHHLTFDTYEVGKLTLDEYLNRVVFFEERPFTKDEYRDFMFEQSQPYPEMLDLVTRVKKMNGLKIAVVSNEGRELNEYRVRRFKLNDIVDFYISSSFARVRKPDVDIYHLALDIAQLPASEVLYIENTPMFVQVAEGLGIRSILHTDYDSTCEQLTAFGLKHEG